MSDARSTALANAPAQDAAPPELTRESLLWQLRRSGSDLQRARGAYRHPFARDRARILHAGAFRRLQGKAQYLGLDELALPRTRMTHAMETGQIARGILRALEGLHNPDLPWMRWLPDVNLIEALAFAQDLGQPPFAATGEYTLNALMRGCGGFSASAQTMRILCHIEPHTEGHGLDPSRRLVLGALRHPVAWARAQSQHNPVSPSRATQVNAEDWAPPRAHYDDDQSIIDWLLLPLTDRDAHAFTALNSPPAQRAHGESGPAGFDASIVNLAEAIAHAAHDLEDAILLGRIQREDWAALPCDEGWAGATGVRPETDGITAALFGRSAPARRRAIGALVNAFIVSIDVENRTDCEHPLLRHQAELIEGARLLLNPLLALVQQRMANTPEARQIAFRGREVLWSLHEALDADPAALLPLDALQAWRDAIDARERARVLCDHLAGMTETQALSLHQRLYGA